MIFNKVDIANSSKSYGEASVGIGIKSTGRNIYLDSNKIAFSDATAVTATLNSYLIPVELYSIKGLDLD